ncbi:hypothetical protein QAD02_001666 [Eretmocerus hayati]|uniref:Uncharacterized protein n=1 Tax=Eretmocerus hayati TaxID=131215 RepID=A0ACC2NJK1_9HYME|nr:hypothetical protein QAD02_001666 [Eretmocerus hayati]
MALITTSWTFDMLTCVLCILIGLYFYLSKNHNYWKNLGVRQIPPKFIFGNVASCVFGRQMPDELFRELYQKADEERMIGFYVFNKPYLMLCDPELIRHVLIKDFQNFSNKILSVDDDDELGKNSLFLVTNPPWNLIRKKLTPVFTSVKLKKMFELMIEICQDFKDYLESFDIDDKIGKPLVVKEMCAQFATDLIGTTAFGMNFNSLKDPNAEFRKHGRTVFRSDYKRYWETLSMFFIPPLKLFTKPKFFDGDGSIFLRNTFWEVINERIKTGIKRFDLIDLLVEIKKNQETDPSETLKLEGDALVAQAAIFFTGGFESSSSTTTLALYELAMNSEIQKQLREEVLSGLQKTNGNITYDLVTSLPYLDAIVHETLRLYPILPWLDRVSESEYTFPGTNVVIEKGTPIMLPMRRLHMDPKYFPDPEVFMPERFLEENRKNIVPFTYFPFGEGPRNCIGSRLGLIQVKLGLIIIISKYELTPCAQTPSPMKFDDLNILIQSPAGLQLNFRKLAS